MLRKGGVAIRDGVNGAMFDGDFIEGVQIGTVHAYWNGGCLAGKQSKYTVDQDSGYVFNHCVITGDARKGIITPGRPWRPYATVICLNARIDAPVIPAGWTEWLRFGTPSLPTAYYAEYHSTAPGASPEAREPYSHQLTAAEAEKWATQEFLGWDPR